ncbi:hypothetical protein [Halopiger aswanensis]|uniref:Rpa-associated protein n=1 Tax=Halopiger aswanensis TaxID=148449 RepID=A0A3R7HKF0_9EURY|nr:hypothetical protein [Halopiger aswanensis]RKD97711.1 hypothetical protein ATJ93_0703 [Halopiger aswanensis]
MSANDDEEMEIPGREVAYRLFAAEYDDASVSYTESDEERAPNYVIAPTGARINRLFAVGTLTEVTSVNDEMVRARVVDPTGAFVVYAGQYQPDELAFLEGIEPPAFVAVTGKARTFQPEDSDQVYTSIRPESIATVDADTRDRWVVSAAEQTVERIELYAAAAEANARGDDLTDILLEQGVEPGLAAGIPLAQEHYGTTPSYLAALRDCALEAVEVVSGDLDQVGPFDALPGETNPAYEDATFDSLADLGVDAVDRSALEAVSSDAEQEPAVEAGSEPEPDSEPEAVAPAAGGDTVESSSAAGTATSEAHDASSETETETDLETETEPVGDDSGVELESEGGIESESESEPETEPAESEPEPASESEPAAASDLESDTGEPADESTDAAASDTDIDGEFDADEPADDEELGDFDANDIGDGMYEMDDEEREQLEEEFGAEFTTGAEVEEPGEADIDVPEPDDGDAAADTGTDAATEAESASDPDLDDDLGAPPTSGLEEETAESDSEGETDVTESEPELEETEAESGAETAAEPDESEPEPESAADESEDETADESDDEPADDVDLQDYVVETMAELDDGDGADRSELVETVAADTGASEDEVEDAIQDALMGGQCYEPNDETLKPI